MIVNREKHFVMASEWEKITLYLWNINLEQIVI